MLHGLGQGSVLAGARHFLYRRCGFTTELTLRKSLGEVWIVPTLGKGVREGSNVCCFALGGRTTPPRHTLEPVIHHHWQLINESMINGLHQNSGGSKGPRPGSFWCRLTPPGVLLRTSLGKHARWYPEIMDCHEASSSCLAQSPLGCRFCSHA